MRYRRAYWIFSFFTVLFIRFRWHGETLVENPFFGMTLILFFLYVPFMIAKTVVQYEEHVQEEEISAMD